MHSKIDLKKPGLCEGQAIFADNDVVENAYVDKRERVFEPAGDRAVCIGSCADTGRMVMRQDAGGGIVTKCGFNDFTGVNATTVDGATKQFFETENTVAIIEPEDRKYFMLQMG